MMQRRRSACLTFLTSVVLGLAVPSAWAQGSGDDGVLVPAPLAAVASDGTTTFVVPGGQVSFLPGIGWTTGWTLPGPLPRQDGVEVTAEVAALLRVPRVTTVRSGVGDAASRLVVDFADLASGLEDADGQLRREATLDGDGSVVWQLPPLAIPVAAAEGVLFERDPVRLEARLDATGAALALSVADVRLTSFPLSDPDRLVIDLEPLGAALEPSPSALRPDGDVAPGVRYRRLRAIGSDGVSTVHVVDLDPAHTELRVVGRSGEGRTVAAWSDGGVAAINAGYFDPTTFTAIGLRRIEGALLSWPSRGRAAVGFGPSGTVVARAGARAQIDVDGVRVADLRLDGQEDLAWSAVAGTRVGSARVGVLVLGPDGRVVSNTIGPRVVPEGGSALAYPADVRPLALVDVGQRVTVGARLLPDPLERAPWAVEAGPLLVEHGRPAFDPEAEAFSRGQRILDEPTQQAALGVRADGTVLFVVAERMIASDLVALMLRLGAESALRLDSGSSATLVAGGRTVNRVLTRPVESAIVAVPRSDTAERR